MSQARCTLTVQGLDCPTEMDAIRAAFKDVPGILGLGFDLIHGTVTVDYEPEALRPSHLIDRLAQRARMQATLLGEPQVRETWWSRHGRWATTAGSGAALLLGVVTWWLESGTKLTPAQIDALFQRLAGEGVGLRS